MEPLSVPARLYGVLPWAPRAASVSPSSQCEKKKRDWPLSQQQPFVIGCAPDPSGLPPWPSFGEGKGGRRLRNEVLWMAVREMGGKGGRKPRLSLAGFDAAHAAGRERMPQPVRSLTLGPIQLAAVRLAGLAGPSSAIGSKSPAMCPEALTGLQRYTGISRRSMVQEIRCGDMRRRVDKQE